MFEVKWRVGAGSDVSDGPHAWTCEVFVELVSRALVVGQVVCPTTILALLFQFQPWSGEQDDEIEPGSSA